MGLWTPGDVALAGSALSDLLITTAVSTSATFQWQLPPWLQDPRGPAGLGGPQLPWHCTPACASAIKAVL